MKKPHYITQELWDSLSWKEQDFIVLLREKRYTQSQIQRKLYITTRMGYDKLRKRVQNKLSLQNTEKGFI